MRNRDQLRAAAAFPRVSEAARQASDKQKKYSTRARQMPSIIHRSGLCQALAFYQAKSNSVNNEAEKWAFSQYLEDLASVVLLDLDIAKRNTDTLLAQSRDFDFSNYQWLSRNSMQSALWLKRYAEALLQDEEESE